MNEDNPFTKLYRASVIVPYHAPVDVLAYVVVEGARVLSRFGSVSLPEYTPLVILRDPPGGGSVATYKNVRTTFIVEHSEMDFITESKYGFNLAVIPAGKKADLCIGAIGAMTCQEAQDFEHEAQKKLTAGYTSKCGPCHSQSTKTKAFEITWSLTTADNPSRAGKHSDMFLTPVLDIVFVEARKVAWDQATCIATSENVFQFGVEPSEGANSAFAWHSYQTITERYILIYSCFSQMMFPLCSKFR